MGRVLSGVGIVVNLFLPGLGSLIMGKWFTGLVQLGVLAVVWLLNTISFHLLSFVFWPVGGIIWVWALVGGILTYIERGHRAALGRPRY